MLRLKRCEHLCAYIVGPSLVILRQVRAVPSVQRIPNDLQFSLRSTLKRPQVFSVRLNQPVVLLHVVFPQGARSMARVQRTKIVLLGVRDLALRVGHGGSRGGRGPMHALLQAVHHDRVRIGPEAFYAALQLRPTALAELLQTSIALASLRAVGIDQWKALYTQGPAPLQRCIVGREGIISR